MSSDQVIEKVTVTERYVPASTAKKETRQQYLEPKSPPKQKQTVTKVKETAKKKPTGEVKTKRNTSTTKKKSKNFD